MAIDFDISADKGIFRYPTNPFQNLVSELDNALDRRDCGELSRKAYVAILERLVACEPDFIDGYAHIGLTLFEEGRFRKALDVYVRGFRAGERAIPMDFDGRIEWEHLDNRPFLRATHGAALCHLRLRRRKDAVFLMEKMLAWNPNDNQGIRHLLGSEYLRLGRTTEARSLFERESEYYPPYQYELALMNLGEENWVAATTSLRRGFCANSYIAEILCGNPNPVPLAIWHGSNLSRPQIATKYVLMHGKLWKDRPDFLAFVRWVYNHPKIMVERASILECQEELLWEHDFERRSSILRRMEAAQERIDDRLSEQIVGPRRDRSGRSVFPWLYPISTRPSEWD